jgi:hypothetical protein
MGKTLLIVAFLLAMLYIYLNRHRIYLRDPIATVYRDGVEQSGVQVFMNYSDDILLEKDGEPGPYRILLQDWNQVPGTPAVLKCIQWMACMTDADRATTWPIEWKGKGKYDPKVTMTNHISSFVDGDGSTIRVTLR